MPNIKFIEEIVDAFLSGKTDMVSSILKKESLISKKSNKNIVSKRLDNLIKKIPATTSYSGANLSDNNAGRNFYEKKFNLNNNSNLVTEFHSNILPEEVVLEDDIKKIVATIFREWDDSERLLKHGLQPANKILLYGPPGTGKTKLAYAIANQLNFPLILVRLDELVSSYLGKTGQNIREIFDIAKNRNVVLFLDEIDTIAKHRTDERELGELKRVVTVLLQNVDLFPNNSLIIGATNHDEILDKAIWRRFPVKIKLDLPNDKSRELLFKLFLGKINKNVDYDLLMKISDGLSGSEIFDLTQQAIKNQIMSGKKNLSNTDILTAHFSLMLGSKISKKMSKKQVYLICQKLKDEGFKLKEIEMLTKIPYTTLKYNIK